MKTPNEFPISDFRFPRSSGHESALINSRFNRPTAGVVEYFQLSDDDSPSPVVASGAATEGRGEGGRFANFAAKSAIRNPQSAFTLIELLVVIAIAVILSGLLLTAGGVMVRKSNIQRAVSERDQLETAIEAYHSKYGYYPPSSQAPGSPLLNQLYYELLGTTVTNNPIYGSANVFTTLDGSSEVKTDAVVNAFGVSAFMNCTKNGANADDSVPAQMFLSGLKAGEIASNGVVNFIVTAANSDLVYKPMPGVYSLAGRPANPWRYVCPGTNNPNSYDLWVQVFVGNHTNLICNWAKDPQLNVPLP